MSAGSIYLVHSTCIQRVTAEPAIAISRDRSRGRITLHLDALRLTSRENAI